MLLIARVLLYTTTLGMMASLTWLHRLSFSWRKLRVEIAISDQNYVVSDQIREANIMSRRVGVPFPEIGLSVQGTFDSSRKSLATCT